MILFDLIQCKIVNLHWKLWIQLMFTTRPVGLICVTCLPLLDGLLFLCSLWCTDLTHWFDKCHPMHHLLLHSEQTDFSCRKCKLNIHFNMSHDISGQIHSQLISAPVFVLSESFHSFRYCTMNYNILHQVSRVPLKENILCAVRLFSRFEEPGKVWIGAHFSIIWHCTSTSSESYPAILGSTKRLAMLGLKPHLFLAFFLVVTCCFGWMILKDAKKETTHESTLWWPSETWCFFQKLLPCNTQEVRGHTPGADQTCGIEGSS